MTIDDLIESGVAELVRGSVRVRQDDRYLVLAKQNGDVLAVTEDGRRYLAQASTTVETAAKPIKAKAKPAAKGASLDDLGSGYDLDD